MRSTAKKKPANAPLGGEPSTVVFLRVTTAMHSLIKKVAKSEDLTIAAVIRAAIKKTYAT